MAQKKPAIKKKTPQSFQRLPIGRKWLVGTVAAVFIAALLLFGLTLAPGVTFEDSGELITAAYTAGVPHQPGYPLFTIIGRCFTLFPFGEIAWRINLMSAVLAAGAAAALAALIVHLLSQIGLANVSRQDAASSRWHYAAGAAGGLLAATAFEFWEQSVITEVYALNSLLVSLFLLTVVLAAGATGSKLRLRYLLAAAYIAGLAVSNHTTALMLIPAGLVFFWQLEGALLRQWQLYGAGGAFIFWGCCPTDIYRWPQRGIPGWTGEIPKIGPTLSEPSPAISMDFRSSTPGRNFRHSLVCLASCCCNNGQWCFPFYSWPGQLPRLADYCSDVPINPPGHFWR